KGKYRNLEIAKFLKVAKFFICNVRKELLSENNKDELAHYQRSANSLTHTEHLSLWKKCMAWHRGKSVCDFLPKIFTCLCIYIL
ncbi:unnamed protein product, partial [Hymenolepis diminuta]